MSRDSLQIEEVKDKAEIPELTHLSVLTLKDDGFSQWIEQYAKTSMFDDTKSKLTAALDDPDAYIFKATLTIENEFGERSETLVGLAQWFLGYAVIPKVDPFAEKPVSDKSTAPQSLTEVAVSDAKMKDSRNGSVKVESFQPNPDLSSDMLRRLGNAYIGTIRGKKHIYLRRLIVHPDFQRRGIGEKLMQWGLNKADTLGIASWLNARPAGMRLYEKTGFCPVATIPFNAPDLDIPPAICMLRKPNPANRQ